MKNQAREVLLSLRGQILPRAALKGLLADRCPECRAERAALLAAVDLGIAADLATASRTTDPSIRLGRLARRLEDDCALTAEAARWTVESFAMYYGLISENQDRLHAEEWYPMAAEKEPSATLTVGPNEHQILVPPSFRAAPGSAAEPYTGTGWVKLTVGPKEHQMRVPPGFHATPGSAAEPYTGTGWANEIVHEATDMAMVYIPAGSFTMGSPAGERGRFRDERQHPVTLTSGFYLGKYQVTQAQWRHVMQTVPSHFKNAGADAPVENVSWDDCHAFFRRLGGGFRLPTEAEWEYAARGGPASRGFIYSGSNNVDDVAWFNGNSGKTTHPVGQKRANELGLYDMSGNVWEWCQNWHGEYPSGDVTDPRGPQTGSYRVCRGGSWYGDAAYCCAANRYYIVPSFRYYYLGFRAALGPSL